MIRSREFENAGYRLFPHKGTRKNYIPHIPNSQEQQKSCDFIQRLHGITMGYYELDTKNWYTDVWKQAECSRFLWNRQ